MFKIVLVKKQKDDACLLLVGTLKGFRLKAEILLRCDTKHHVNLVASVVPV